MDTGRNSLKLKQQQQQQQQHQQQQQQQQQQHQNLINKILCFAVNPNSVSDLEGKYMHTSSTSIKRTTSNKKLLQSNLS